MGGWNRSLMALSNGNISPNGSLRCVFTGPIDVALFSLLWLRMITTATMMMLAGKGNAVHRPYPSRLASPSAIQPQFRDMTLVNMYKEHDVRSGLS